MFSSVFRQIQRGAQQIHRCVVPSAKSVQPNINLFSATSNRLYSTQKKSERLAKTRNIGISAHIDSGKTTLTERILYYTGRIQEIHEVRGTDGVGAKMDSMDLEREKGITIKSAATYVRWGDHHINIIDTPGHVDFTIEVERSLKVLDGAVLVLCGVSGVQSQTFTVDRQMRRYKVPRLVFINKLDRLGADPWRAVSQLRSKLGLHAAAVQAPIGLEGNHNGVVDLVEMQAVYFQGINGRNVVREPIPENLQEIAEEKRQALVETLGDVDEVIGEKLVSELEVTNSDVKAAIRRGVVSMKFVPVFMGSAFKNRGVQLLLDGVLAYLPDPTEVENLAFMKEDETKSFPVNQVDPAQPLIAYAFKLEESKFGQLTYMRIYQGTLRKGNWIRNVMTDKKVKVPRLVRMHSEEMEDVDKLEAGDICAIFGVDCSTGTTFTDQNESKNYLMSSMHVPEPVMSLAITTKSREQANNFTKALRRFQKEDPTFRVTNDNETGEILISGMGELHLEIYVERMRREYKVDAKVGKPQVAYRETIQRKSVFETLHKKQSGGQGQYAKLLGFLEPIADEEGMVKEFIDATIGGTVPPNLVPAVIKGYEDCLAQGPMTGFPVERVRMVITDGNWHPVDSTEIAFRTCSQMAFKEAFKNGDPSILEPIMSIELVVPNEFQGAVVGLFNRRKGVITESSTEGDIVTVSGEVPLNNMFGFSTELRSNTQGKGEFSMEYKRHDYVPRDQLQHLFELYKDHKRSAPSQ